MHWRGYFCNIKKTTVVNEEVVLVMSALYFRRSGESHYLLYLLISLMDLLPLTKDLSAISPFKWKIIIESPKKVR